MQPQNKFSTYTNSYETTLDGLWKMLRENGVAVLPGLLTPEECSSVEEGMWDCLKKTTEEWKSPINKSDKATWDLSNFSPLHGMLIQHHSVGHWQPVWDVRQNPKVVNVFKSLWETEDLLVSFDGVSISLPPEITNKGWHRGSLDTSGKSSLTLHCDTSYVNNGKPNDCVQGWVTPLEVKDGDATLAFLKGSHKYHSQFGKKYEITDKSNWNKLSEEQVDTYVLEYGCPLQRIKCPAGSIVLWDSKTIHCGQQPLKGRPEQNVRLCIYVCMLPRTRSTAANLKKKRKAFEELRLTTHDAATIKLFPMNPRIWSSEQKMKLEVIKLPDNPKLSSAGTKLAGY